MSRQALVKIVNPITLVRCVRDGRSPAAIIPHKGRMAGQVELWITGTRERSTPDGSVTVTYRAGRQFSNHSKSREGILSKGFLRSNDGVPELPALYQNA